jgi:RNA polymerase sigma-70 factor (ECF subfamily)
VFAWISDVVASPAIFLAFQSLEIKQAKGRVPSTAKMIPPLTGKAEIDPATIRRVAAGDTAAFEQVYDAFSGILYSLALRMLDRPEDAEELLQEVFAKMWSDAGEYDARRGAPIAWAIAMTRNKAIDRIRSTTRRLRLYEAAEEEAKNNPATSIPQPQQEAERSENVKAVRNSVGKLEPEVRESIELAFFGGLSHSQIAERLSIPVTTVKSRIRRAMMELRQSLRQYA